MKGYLAFIAGCAIGRLVSLAVVTLTGLTGLTAAFVFGQITMPWHQECSGCQPAA